MGETIDTEQGPVQVQVTMTGTTITDVTVLQYPNGGGRDQEINSAALPRLVQQAIAVQSADIQMVSGATYLDRVHPIVAERVGPSVTTKHTEHVMGTVFSIHVADEGDGNAAIAARYGYEAFAVTDDGTCWATAVFSAASAVGSELSRAG